MARFLPRRPLLVVAITLSALAALACAQSGGIAILSTVGDSIGGAPAASPGAGGPSTGRNSDQGTKTGSDSDPFAPRDDAKIVRTGSISLQVEDVTAAVGRARAAIHGVGGYIGESHQARSDDRPVASITYRIPTDRWDDAVDALRGLGTVVEEQTEAVEITGQLVDLAARIENLRASEQALQQIAASATRIPDVLEVQQRLSEVRGQIEQLTAQQAHLEDRASYGTLTVTFGEEVEAIAEAAEDWSAGTEVERASASLVDILQALATAGIWFGIVWLPMLILLGVLSFVGLVVLRRLGFVRREIPPAAASPGG
jgi:hypothetical protein